MSYLAQYAAANGANRKIDEMDRRRNSGAVRFGSTGPVPPASVPPPTTPTVLAPAAAPATEMGFLNKYTNCDQNTLNAFIVVLVLVLLLIAAKNAKML